MNQPGGFVIWKSANVRGACSLSGMTGFPDDWKLVHGVPVVDDFPSRAKFAMDPDDLNGVMLTDHLWNLDRLVIASQRLRELIESQAPAAIEYLPARIVDHKKRVVAAPYTIIHPIDPVDCLALDRCEPQWSGIDKASIDEMVRFVIDESRVPVDRWIFRPRHYSKVVLVRRDLAERISAAGMSGIRWVEPDDFRP